MRGLPYRCLLASKDARTSTFSWRSRLAWADFRPATPRVVAARRDVECPTQLADLEGGLLRGDPGELHDWCFAKKAAAFFRISRSVRSSRFSLRSRASSSRSAVVSPVRPLVRSARARAVHPRAERGL